MSIALIAKDEVTGASAGEHLAAEGAEELSVLTVREILDEGRAVGGADLVFLILPTQELLTAGEAVSQIRGRLGDGQTLVLCMSRPHESQRPQLVEAGAHEIISPAGLFAKQIAERILGHLILHRRVSPYSFGKVLGATPPMRKVYDKIKRYAPLEFSVLLLGETGTGKGLAAGELHAECRRQTGRRGDFIKIDCTALNEGTMEAELFGHLKGIYTGAYANHKGLIETAHGGSAFLDEIGDFKAEYQAKLLDAVEQKRVRPIGANNYTDVDVRFIFATHRKLEKLVGDGLFREDLFERINELSLELPPLRERKADIPLLVEHFVDGFNEKRDWNVTVAGGAVDELFRYDWRRNVRSLRNVVWKAAVDAGPGGVISAFILSDEDRAPSEGRPDGAGETPPADVPPPADISPRDGASARADVIEINPRVESWESLKDRAHKTYFTLLASVCANMREASERSGRQHSRLSEIFRKYGLRIGGDSPQPDHDGGTHARTPDSKE